MEKNKIRTCKDILLLAENNPEYINYELMFIFVHFSKIYVNHIADELLIEQLDDEDEDWHCKKTKRFNSDYVCMFELEEKNENLTLGDVVNTIKKYSIPDNYTIHIKFKEIDMSVYVSYIDIHEVNKFFVAKDKKNKKEYIYLRAYKTYEVTKYYELTNITNLN